MKSKLFFAGYIIVILLIVGFRYVKINEQPKHITREDAYKYKSSIQCSPDWTQLNADSLANGIGVLPGWGNYIWNINTQNDSARFYFNQGINMYYAFHIIEAMTSFKKAGRFDDKNAMIYWAQALAYGPNINDFEYSAAPDAFAAAQKVLSLQNNFSLKEKALIAAMGLRNSTNNMPGVSHMIHMPSHIYIRNGEYAKGIKVNEMSVKCYDNYLALYPDVQKNAGLYLIHNLHMQTNCAMMKANYIYSNKSAIATRNSIDTNYLSIPAPGGTYMQYLYMTPTLNNVRFGKWDFILNDSPINENHIYSSTLWHWARAMALVTKNKFVEADIELKIVQEKIKSPEMLVVMAPYNAPADAAKVAVNILKGIIAAKNKDYITAIRLLSEAVIYEDNMIYNEPKDWLLPAREYLGTVLLKSGNSLKAIKIFEDDLKENPNNHWSLYGLYQALQQQKKIETAKIIKNQFDKAFENADIAPGAFGFKIRRTIKKYNPASSNYFDALEL